MRISTVYIVAALALLTACEAQSDIQAAYMGQQSTCRDVAEDRMDSTPPEKIASAKQRNAQLVDYFSTCMIRAGWHVARPVKNPIVPTPRGTAKNATEAALPAQPVKAAPPAARAATPANPNVPNPSGEAVKTQTTTLQPSASTPALNEPVTTPQPQSGAATYQPARDYTLPQAPQNPPAYSNSPGRQF